MKKNERISNGIGWFASAMAMCMYFSYIDQVIRNLDGNKGSIILPIITAINCTAWVLYGGLKSTKDWPIIVCNAPGIALGIITAVTAFI